MNINQLQETIEDIYEIDTVHRAEHFVFSDPNLARQLDTTPCAREIPEKLLVHQHEGGLDISLYLDAGLLRHLRESNPFENLHHNNLNAFCQVVEGISHFIYLIWKSAYGRQVTQLEMEIQAEIDKYVICAALLARQRNGYIPHDLHECLFERVYFDVQLRGEERQRYITANDYAKRYCLLLHDYLVRLGDGVLITREIRRFYRLSNGQKIQRIHALEKLH